MSSRAFSKCLCALAATYAVVSACRSEPKPAANMPKVAVEKLTLANGLTVLLHKDDKLPAVNVNVWYHAGSKDELPGKTGLAHLFEHLMFQGSKNAPNEYLAQIERAGANLKGGGVDGTADADRANFFATVPTGSLEYALWIEADRMGFLLDVLDQKKFDTQRDAVLAEMRQSDARPYGAQRSIVAGSMYPPGHPYSHTVMGNPDDLAKMSLDDAKAFFRAHYGPSNATLTLSGNFDAEAAKTMIERYFGSLPPAEPSTRVKAGVPALVSDVVAEREERGAPPKLALVWHAPPYFSADEAPLEIAAEILGDGLNARLFKRLVREEKLATKLSAYVTPAELAGLFYVEVLANETASFGKIKDIVMAEIKRLAESGPTEVELEQRRSAREYGFLSELERIGGYGGKADRLSRYQTYLGSPVRFDADFARYRAVTQADVRRVTKDWLESRRHLEIRFTPSTTVQAGAEPDRTTPPAFAQTTPFTVPEIRRATLPSGLELYVVTRQDLPKVETAVIIKQLDLEETEATAGTSYMTAVTINEGTRSRNAEAIQSELAALGAQLSTEGSKFGAAVALSSLKRTLSGSLAILADVVQNPAFPDAEIELAKKVRIDQILQDTANPALLASDLLPRLVFPGHPAGIPDRGSETSIRGLTRDVLAKHHAAYWVPANAAVLMVGDVTLDEARRLVEIHFSGWAAHEPPKQTLAAPATPDRMTIFLVDAPGATQSQIRVSGHLPARGAKDQIALEMASSLLGGTFSSRLNLNLREEKVSTQGAFSSLRQNAFFGSWQAAATVPTGSTVAALIEFKREIEGLGGAIPIRDEELTGLKTNLTRSFQQNYETLSQVVRQIAPLISGKAPLDYLANFVPSVTAATAEQVTAAAAKNMAMDHAITLVVGDLSIIEQPIVTLGWGPVQVLDASGKVVRAH